MDLESFTSRAEFLAKVCDYPLYFHLACPNSHKRGLAPWQIIQQLAPRLPLHLCLLPPLILDYRLDAMRRDDPTTKGDTIYPGFPNRKDRLPGSHEIPGWGGDAMLPSAYTRPGE